jgi:trehalose 6-phosphate phosphatase
VGGEIRTAGEFEGNATLSAAVERLNRDGSGSGLLFDFDGVLARIQDDPASVWPSAGAIEALQDLSSRIGTIAIVSSRNADFLYARLNAVKGIRIYGLYGLEQAAADGTVMVEPRARGWLAAARRLWSEATRALPDVYVEDKRLSVGLHYRRVPQARDAVETWAREAAERTGFRMQPGRMAVELKPPLDIDKGSTVENIVDGLKAAWYFGDDLGDLPAFAALRRKNDTDERFSGLAVGVGNDTVVDEVLRNTDVFLTSQQLVVDLLRYVRDGVRR